MVIKLMSLRHVSENASSLALIRQNVVTVSLFKNCPKGGLMVDKKTVLFGFNFSVIQKHKWKQKYPYVKIRARNEGEVCCPVVKQGC